MEGLVFFLTHLIMFCCMLLIGWIVMEDNDWLKSLSRYLLLLSVFINRTHLLKKPADSKMNGRHRTLLQKTV
jgi:hypothetical protein